MIANPPVELTDLSDVERALAASRAGGPGSVRATTLNLVAFAPTPADVAFTQRALERLGGSRPLRAIIAGPGANGLRASVSASCWLGGGLQHVCSEQVVLTARADALPSAVLSLLVPDLPVFVWWQGPMPSELALLCPSETTIPRLTQISISSSAPDSSGASVTMRTGPAASRRSSSGTEGERR